MPIYEYKCDNGHVFDVIQRMSDEPLTKCQECGAHAVRVLHPVAIHFKGSGFHNTDYGKKGSAGGNGSGSSESSGESKGSSESKGSGESKSASESKPADAKKPESKAAASD